MTWTHLNVSLGKLPSDPAQTSSYQIPFTPDGTTEILVYAWIRTGNVNFQPDCEFFISVDDPDGDHPAGFYLFSAGSTPGPTYAYNSDNVWLPLPKSGELHAKISTGQGYNGDIATELRIVACR
jgi:hypothetical protein